MTIRRINQTVCVTALTALIGCASFTSKITGEPAVTSEAIEQHRAEFLETRDEDAMRWLFKSAIRSGMSRGEVAQVLGEDGERVRNDARFKRNGGHYREDDQLWKWGPDNRGNTVLLAFRDNKLVNFSPDEFGDDELEHADFVEPDSDQENF